jgi:Ca2+-binding EF-hand superfamily protein
MQKWFVSVLAVSLLAGCSAPLGAVSSAGMVKASKVRASAKLTGAGIFKRLDDSKDGRLSLPEFRQLGMFGVNELLFPAGQPLPPLPTAQAATFESFDKNHDQAVSDAEFENFGVALQYALEFDSPSEFFTTMFPTLDLDHDARLAPAEWERMGIFGVHGVGAGPESPAAPLGQLQAQTFKLLDSDHDGFLSLAELTFK